MLISELKVENYGDCNQISAVVDNFKVWFKLPAKYGYTSLADPFLAVALLPAMSQGEDIIVDPGMKVSTILLDNCNRLQDIFHCWNPKLKKIRTTANTKPAVISNKGVISFFSGGVDSQYTLLKNIDDITHVINIHGFDFLFMEGNAHDGFAQEDIKDLSQLIRRIVRPDKTIAEELRKSLSASCLDKLTKYIVENKSPNEIEKDLLLWLNDLIRSGSITKRMLTESFPRELVGKYAGSYNQTLKKNEEFANYYRKELIKIETNHYAFGYRYNLGRNLTQGSCLGAVSLLTGFPKAFIPSACSYGQLFPLGSHPLTDPLWGNEAVSIVHDGCEVGRTGKVKLIVQNGFALEALRVCLDSNDENCGKCTKCLRTMVTLHILGAKSSSFPQVGRSQIRSATLQGRIDDVFFNENLQLAREFRDKKTEEDLMYCWKRNRRRRLFFRIASKAKKLTELFAVTNNKSRIKNYGRIDT